MPVHEKRYLVTETRTVVVLVEEDDDESEALRVAQRAFLNPTPEANVRIWKPVQVVKTVIEQTS